MSKSELLIVSRGNEAGSLSTLSSVFVALPAAVFQGTEMILTGLPSTDSMADTVNSWVNIGIRSPWSVMMYLKVLGSVTVPVI